MQALQRSRISECMLRFIQSYRPFDRNFKEHTVSENTQDQHILSIFHDLVSLPFFLHFMPRICIPGSTPPSPPPPLYTPLYYPNSLLRPARKRNRMIINLKERGVKLFIRVKKEGRSMRRRRSWEEKKKVATWVNMRVLRTTKVSINTFEAHSRSQSPQSWPQG